MDLKGIAERVRSLRKARGWSQLELAQRVGLSDAWISRIENAIVPSPRYDDLMKLAGAFDISIAELLGEDRDAIRELVDQITDDPAIQYTLVTMVTELRDRSDEQRRFLLSAIETLLKHYPPARPPDGDRPAG